MSYCRLTIGLTLPGPDRSLLMHPVVITAGKKYLPKAIPTVSDIFEHSHAYAARHVLWITLSVAKRLICSYRVISI